MIDHMFIHGCSHTAAVELPSWENNEQGLPSKDSLIRDIPQRCYEDSWANQLGVKFKEKKSNRKKGSALLYIFEDGTVEKRIALE